MENVKRSVHLVEASCEDHADPHACDEVAADFAFGVIVKKDEAKAQVLWSKALPGLVTACDHGDHVACRDAEDLYRKGRGAPASLPNADRLHAKAVKLYLKACPAGDLDACEELATEYHLGPGVKVNEAKAQALQKKLCAAGRPDACITLAQPLPDGAARSKLESQAYAQWRRACFDERSGVDCRVFGLTVDDPSHAPAYRDTAQGISAFSRGCELGDATSCQYAADNLAEKGQATEAERFRQRHITLAQAACDAPIPVECANLAYEFESGTSLPKDPTRALQLHQKACSGGLVTECAKVSGR